METISQIVMPKLGLTMTEGLVASWLVKPGDEVQPGDVLVVIETDKIANEVEAQHAGRIVSIAVQEGETVPVGTPIATWTGPGTVAGVQPSMPDDPLVPDSVAVTQARPGGSEGRVLATPLARRLARAHNVDIMAVCGSGPNGRVKALDVLAAADSTNEGRTADAASSARGAGQRRPATSIERIVAHRLTQSQQTIPHFYVVSEADVTGIERVRSERDGDGLLKPSVTHCLVAAAARALVDVPEANILWDDGDIVTPATVDIGIAVDSARGLLVPVLRDVGAMTIDDVARLSRPLVDRAREGRLKPDEMEGGVLSISNVGMFGATALVPLVNPGQSAILGVGAPRETFRPCEHGAPVLRREISVTLSCDHRAMNGALAARLLERIRFYIEHPEHLTLT